MNNQPVSEKSKEAPIHWTASIIIIILSIVALAFFSFIGFVVVLALGFIPMQIYDRKKYGKKFDKMTTDDYGKTIG